MSFIWLLLVSVLLEESVYLLADELALVADCEATTLDAEVEVWGGIGCDELTDRCLVLGDRAATDEEDVGDVVVIIGAALTPPTIDEDEDVLRRSRDELLICESGTDDDEDEFLTVFTLVSESAKSFLTASGECAPF